MCSVSISQHYENVSFSLRAGRDDATLFISEKNPCFVFLPSLTHSFPYIFPSVFSFPAFHVQVIFLFMLCSSCQGKKLPSIFLVACLLFTSCFAHHSNIVTKERGNRLMLFNIKMLNLCFCNLLHFLSVRDLRCFLLSAKQTCSDLPVFLSLLSVLFLPFFPRFL